MSKHTPGPWQLAGFNPDTCHIELETVERGDDVPSQGYTLGKLYAGPDGPTADNLLIAAAPDLLDALRAVMNDCREVLDGREPLTMELIHYIVNGKARAAIRKATGE